MRFTLLIVGIFCLCNGAIAQVIGITHPEKLTEKTFSLKYENDAFGNTDYYYTQGTQLLFTHPGFAKNPLNNFLLIGNGETSVLGIGLEHIGYTPTSILSDSILRGDRPFAAAIMLECFAVNINTIKRNRISSLLSIGLIGPGAGGEEIQAEIHRNTNNPIPHGWEYQVSNDLVLNYYFRCDHNIMKLDRFFTLDISGGASLGTLNDKAFVGAIASTGLMNQQIFNRDRKDFYLQLQYQPVVSLIGYDATMQGGLFSRKNIYTVAAKNISRITFKQEIDLTLTYKSLQISANLVWLSKEFNTGKNHSWGGIQCAVHL